MLNKLTIENFKSIEKQEFTFNPITILTGLNSTGKSSVIQSLLLLSSFSSTNNLLNKNIKKFSNFNDIRNRYINAKNISLSVESENDSSTLSIEQARSWKIGIPCDSNVLNFEENLFYISANRRGQEDIANYDEEVKFGVEGEYVFGYFEQFKNKPIEEKLIAYKEHKTLDAQLSYWLEFILDITLRVVTEIMTAEKVKVTFESDGLDNLSPFNLGAGNSYLAKILIIGLSCKKGNILIIENPEIHLHPKAQSKLSDFFVLLANAGIQVILETHSEHLINKLRYNIYKSKLSSDDAIIYYKSNIREEFSTIKINNNGHYIDEENKRIAFPKGFFDSTLNELLEIM